MSTSQLDPHTHPGQKKPAPAPQSETDPRPISPRTAVIGGLLWMVAGPMTLFMSALALVLKADSFWTAADGFYVAGLAAMFVGRWLEFRSGAAETEDGKPLSARSLYRYYFLLGSTGLAVWLAASAIRMARLIH
ncbi:MAG TPA: hypothetical protein VMG10_06290 [Gemmataceae bacterium]|nr:hypothetical protein [Gemmataceae bacterium]